MTGREKQILAILKGSKSGMRLRDIGRELKTWHCYLVGDIGHLCELGLVCELEYKDLANMENYIIYKLAE